MAKFFAVTIIVIAIASAIPILRHSWPAPQDISVHGHLIDEQMSETMAEAGISFLAAQFILAIFIWKFSNRPKDAKIGKFPGGAKGLVIAAFLRQPSPSASEFRTPRARRLRCSFRPVRSQWCTNPCHQW